MEAVTLKGRKAGFELQLADWAGISELTAQLQTLLARLATDTPEGNVDFMIETGDRVLGADQLAEVTRVFDDFPRFSIKSVHAEVDHVVPLRQRFLAQSIHLVGGIVRSGQVVDCTGDVLFVGTLHQSATLRATRSIFVLGEVAGLLIAGYTGDQDAVIAGDISKAGQIRIADTVEVVEANDYGPQTLCYINDLHILDHGALSDLGKLRPKLFRKLEDL
ncbi:septum site-determining protein MinC [Lacticaseibacillus daqingensis]|uniref:septum site-determining protein MinC n=1 Tax=Lacticaseibacillus daqingensis TaxID=2486014 RepID=UPI000F7965C0|nr:septum site-determining protein MinC [Lacticaseibacillus daqingensis]